MPVPKHGSSRVLVLLVLSASLAAIAAAVTYKARRVFPRPRPVTLSEVTAITGIAFPQGTHLRESLYHSWPTASYLWAAVTMDSEDADWLMETYGNASRRQFISGTFEDLDGFTVGDPPSWWPKRSQQATVADSWLRAGRPRPVGLFNAAVVSTGSGQVIVYIFWSSG